VDATAGRTALTQQFSNVYAENFLPGAVAAGVADLVVCNGGSPTTYQALAAGKPVLGIPSNLDQCLNIAALKSAGVGKILRVGALSLDSIRRVADCTLTGLDTNRLVSLSREILLMDAASSLKKVLGGLL
jgi:UDP:flavonoid glycosyltransferase YjiC (YdhE family)